MDRNTARNLLLLAAAAYFAAYFLDLPALRLVTKPLPALILALSLAPWRGRDTRWIAAGLVLSLAGDYLLEASRDYFVAGLVAFLLAHVAYLRAFVGRTRAPHLARLLPMIAFGFVVYRWLEPSLGEMRGPVLAYVVVICTMVWRALAQVGERPGQEAAAWCAAIGAVLFALSDVLVAYTRFIAPSVVAHVALMLLYWAAQTLIAHSVERARPAV